jgi:V8-like Glu-specific endopeptidase
MSWDRSLTQLVDLLAGIYRNPSDAELVARRAGLPLENIDLSGRPKTMWMRIVEEARLQKSLDALVAAVHEQYPNIDFPTLKRESDQRGSVGSIIDERDWKGNDLSGNHLEKVTGAQPTFLPISFLETGIARARAVCQVITPTGLATGFLTVNNLLITNHHVISDREAALKSQVRFNFQQTQTGCDLEAVAYELDPDDAFASSPMGKGDDWTAVRIKQNPNERWGSIELDADVQIGVESYVNIIQHPAGQPKVIALYHNIVAYADGSRIQYLTDTLPGSSGSPVFDSQWRVVALHHSGGWITEPGSKKVFFRNEGIHVSRLRAGLVSAGLL